MWVQSAGGLILTRHKQKYLEKNLLQCNFFPREVDWDWTQAFMVNSQWLTPSDIICVYFWCVEVHICGDKWIFCPENWGILYEILDSNKAEGTTIWWKAMYPIFTRTVEEHGTSLFIFPALFVQSIKKVFKNVFRVPAKTVMLLEFSTVFVFAKVSCCLCWNCFPYCFCHYKILKTKL
jgi:hypothetical protein